MNATVSEWAIRIGALAEHELRHLLQPAPHPLAALPATVSYGLSLQALRPRFRGRSMAELPADIRASVFERQLAYIAGRLSAEYGLAQLGVHAPVGRGPDGVPLWPSGVLASITHTADLACAACSRHPLLKGLGIDSERHLGAAELAGILPIFASQAEQGLLRSQPAPDLAATVLFSAKEAAYKAIHHRIGRFIDFHELEMTRLNGQTGTLTLRPAPNTDLHRHLAQLQASFVTDAHHVHTAVAWTGAAVA